MNLISKAQSIRYRGFLLEVDYILVEGDTNKHHYLVKCLNPPHHLPTACLGNKTEDVIKTIKAYSEEILTSGNEVRVRLTKRARQINPNLASLLGIE